MQFINFPDNYDIVYQKMTWQGARVLALGYKNLGEMQAKDVCNVIKIVLDLEILSMLQLQQQLIQSICILNPPPP